MLSAVSTGCNGQAAVTLHALCRLIVALRRSVTKVNTVLKSTETIRLIRGGEKRGRGWSWGERDLDIGISMDLDIGISMDLDIAAWVYHAHNDTGRARQDLILALASVGLLVGPLPAHTASVLNTAHAGQLPRKASDGTVNSQPTWAHCAASRQETVSTRHSLTPTLPLPTL